MTTKYNSNIFDSLKDALSTKEVENAFKDFLKMEPDKTYIVRLLPNMEDGKRTRFHYYQHVFPSLLSTKKISVLCPHTYGEKCPIDEYRSKAYAGKNETLIEQTKPLKRSEKWLYNVLVIKDPTNPDNQGQVKILNAGIQLNKIIQNAIDGDDKDEFGYRIFDLSPNGCNLKIKVEKNDGGYPTYVSSKFMSPSEIDDLDDADEVYGKVKSLDTIFQHKSYDEIKNLMDVHFFGKDVSTENESDDEVIEDEVEVTTTDTTTSKPALSEHDKKMQDILKDL
jgi:gp32 DNA binding protein like